MSYAVIIPSRNAANLIPCLTALRKHEPACPIVVVDDGIGPQGIDQALFCAPIAFVAGQKPFVFSRNINEGIRTAADYWGPLDGYVALNDDALLESPGGFTLLARCCEESPDIGIIGATTNLTGQPLQRPRPYLVNSGVSNSWGLRYVPHIAFVAVYIPRRTMLHIQGRDGNCEPIAETSHVYTGGYLDERYAAGYGSEDLDYCMQVEHAGLKVAVHDGCFVDHSKLHSSFRGAPEAAGDIWPNHRILREKWGLPPNPQDPQYQQLVRAEVSERS